MGGRAQVKLSLHGQIEDLAVGFARSWQRPASEAELKGLIDERVKDEIAVREALSMGLDRDDTIIRRRLRQKLEFLTEDMVASNPPTDAELQAWMTLHPEPFRTGEQVAFRQVYLNAEHRGAAASVDAERLLTNLRAAGPDAATDHLGESSCSDEGRVTWHPNWYRTSKSNHQRRRVDLAAVRRGSSRPQVVHQDDQDIRCPLGEVFRLDALLVHRVFHRQSGSGGGRCGGKGQHFLRSSYVRERPSQHEVGDGEDGIPFHVHFKKILRCRGQLSSVVLHLLTDSSLRQEVSACGEGSCTHGSLRCGRE